MQMQKEIQLADNVILLDVGFLNGIANGLKNALENRLQRSLPPIDLVQWLSYIALDAGLRGGDNEIQVLLLHDAAEKEMVGCLPSSLTELDGNACRDALGEFVFYAVNAAEMVDKEQLFTDLMTLAIDSANVKRLMLLPNHLQYADKVEGALNKLASDKGGESCKKAVYFSLQPTAQSLPCQADSVVFSLAQAFGINPDEL